MGRFADAKSSTSDASHTFEEEAKNIKVDDRCEVDFGEGNEEGLRKRGTVKYVGKFILKEIRLPVVLKIKIFIQVKPNSSRVIGLVFNMMSQLENTMGRMYYISNKSFFLNNYFSFSITLFYLVFKVNVISSAPQNMVHLLDQIK